MARAGKVPTAKVYAGPWGADGEAKIIGAGGRLRWPSDTRVRIHPKGRLRVYKMPTPQPRDPKTGRFIRKEAK